MQQPNTQHCHLPYPLPRLLSFAESPSLYSLNSVSVPTAHMEGQRLLHGASRNHPKKMCLQFYLLSFISLYSELLLGTDLKAALLPQH